MIRLTEDVMLEVQKRGCPPLETFIFSTRIKMWPVWQKGMGEHVDGVKKMAEGASGGGSALGAMWRKTTVSEAAVMTVSIKSCAFELLNGQLISRQICHRYVVMFNSFVALTSQQEETMIFSKYVHCLAISMLRWTPQVCFCPSFRTRPYKTRPD